MQDKKTTDKKNNELGENEVIQEEIKKDNTFQFEQDISKRENLICSEEGIKEDSNEEISIEEMKNKLEQLSQEVQKERIKAENYYRRLLRMEADFDKFRQRVRQEKEELQVMAAERIISNLLPILDNFERGIKAGEKTRDFDRLLSGLEMVYRGFQEVLFKEGLEVMDVVGEEFDPEKHEAMLQVPLEEGKVDNTVVQELQRGYKFKGKVIRPARVSVAKDSEKKPEE